MNPGRMQETGLCIPDWVDYQCVTRLCCSISPSSILLRNDETVRACTASFTLGASAGNTTNDPSCLPNGSLTQVQESLQLAFNETSTPATLEDFEAASKQLAAALSRRDSNCTDITSFTYSNSVALGLFAGSGVRGIPAFVLQQLITKAKSTGFSNSMVVQLCAKDGRSSKYSFGIAASGNRDVSFVQDAVATWASGECITSYDKAEPWQDITLSVPSLLSNGSARFGNSTAGTIPLTSRNSNIFDRRALCSTIQVVSGDTCEYRWQSLLRWDSPLMLWFRRKSGGRVWRFSP